MFNLAWWIFSTTDSPQFPCSFHYYFLYVLLHREWYHLCQLKAMLSQLQQRGTHSTGLLISLPAQPDRPILPWPHSSISQLGEKPGFSIALYQKKTFDPEHKQDRYHTKGGHLFLCLLVLEDKTRKRSFQHGKSLGSKVFLGLLLKDSNHPFLGKLFLLFCMDSAYDTRWLKRDFDTKPCHKCRHW